MEIHERIRMLRKKYLNLSQEEFGRRLGVSRDTIGNIELNRLARPEQKLSLIKLMCKEFGVNEEWLLHGLGEIFPDNSESFFIQLEELMNLMPDCPRKKLFRAVMDSSDEDIDALLRIIHKIV